MDRERVALLTRELGDPELAERLTAARATVVTAVPEEVARRHLRAMTVAAGATAASVASVGTATHAAATVGAASAAGGVAASSGSVAVATSGWSFAALGGLKVAIAAAATAVATAGGLAATGHLPAPAQEVVDQLIGRDVDGAEPAEEATPGPDARPEDAHPWAPLEDAGLPSADGSEPDERTERAGGADRADDVARDDDASHARDGAPPGARDDHGPADDRTTSEGPPGAQDSPDATDPSTPKGPKDTKDAKEPGGAPEAPQETPGERRTTPEPAPPGGPDQGRSRAEQAPDETGQAPDDAGPAPDDAGQARGRSEGPAAGPAGSGSPGAAGVVSRAPHDRDTRSVGRDEAGGSAGGDREAEGAPS